jgi:hypothetical protein
LINRNIAYACAALVIVCICGALALAASIYGLSAIVDWFNRANEWAAQGNTCYASAFVPLSIGAVLWKSRSRRV